MHLPVTVSYIDRRRQVQHGPEVADPGSSSDDDVVAADRALVGLDGPDGSVGDIQAGDAHSSEDPHALRLGLGGETEHGGAIVGVAAPALVQDVGDARGLPVAQQLAQVGSARGFALDERRGIADLLLLGIDLRDTSAHHLGRCLQVADRVVGEGRRV
jgi:hypothetical protein